MLAKIAALAGIEALIPPGDQTPSGITARFGADIVRYFPGRDARKVQCPAHFGMCEEDSLAPPSPTLRHVCKAPKEEVRMSPAGTSTSTSATPSNATWRSSWISSPGTSRPVTAARIRRYAEAAWNG